MTGWLVALTAGAAAGAIALAWKLGRASALSQLAPELTRRDLVIDAFKAAQDHEPCKQSLRKMAGYIAWLEGRNDTLETDPARLVADLEEYLAEEAGP